MTTAQATEEVQADEAAIKLINEGPAYHMRRVEFPLILPCGIEMPDGTVQREVELWPMTGVEEDLLTNEKMAKAGHWTNINKLVANCLKRVGTVEFSQARERKPAEQKASEDLVQRLLISDRSFLLICLRWYSLKEEYVHRFQHVCATATCRKEFIHVLDLRELEVWPVQNPDTRVFEFKLPRTGSVAHYRQLQVKDEPSIADIVNRHGETAMSASLWLRIIDIGGQKVVSHRDLQHLSTFDRDALREDMNKTDGGFLLEMTLECPNCKNVERLPLRVDASFFLPSSIASKRRSKTET